MKPEEWEILRKKTKAEELDILKSLKEEEKARRYNYSFQVKQPTRKIPLVCTFPEP